MAICNKKNIRLLLAFIASLVPSISSNAANEKKEPTTFHKIYLKYEHKGKGSFGLISQFPLDFDTIVHLNICFDTIEKVSPLYKVTSGPNQQLEQTYLFKDYDFSDTEKTLESVKKIITALYVEQTDETGDQSRSLGIMKDGYDGRTSIGVSFETPAVKIFLDMEGILRKLTQKISESNENDDSYSKSSSAFGTIQLKWEDINDYIEEVVLKLKISKGDFAPFGANNGSNLFKYLGGIYFSVKMEEPVFDIFHTFIIKYTHLKESRHDKKEDEALGKLRSIPALSLIIKCDKIELFGEEADVDLGLDFVQCDMTGQYYKKPNTANDTASDPFHLCVSLKLDFKNIFGEENLTFSPKIKVFWAPDYNPEWTDITSYNAFLWDLSLVLKKEMKIAEYYSL